MRGCRWCSWRATNQYLAAIEEYAQATPQCAVALLAPKLTLNAPVQRFEVDRTVGARARGLRPNFRRRYFAVLVS